VPRKMHAELTERSINTSIRARNENVTGTGNRTQTERGTQAEKVKNAILNVTAAAEVTGTGNTKETDETDIKILTRKDGTGTQTDALILIYLVSQTDEDLMSVKHMKMVEGRQARTHLKQLQSLQAQQQSHNQRLKVQQSSHKCENLVEKCQCLLRRPTGELDGHKH